MYNEKKYLTAIPYGGLCNRLLFLNSICEYAQNANLRVNVIWFKNNEIYATLDELFEYNADKFTIINIDAHKISGCVIQILYKILRKMKMFMVDQLTYYDSNSKEYLRSEFIKSIKEKQIITGCQNVYDEYSKNLFTPKDEYYRQSGKIIDDSDTSIVSMHIRRTDNADSIKVSSDDKIIKAIDLEISNNNKVFIACDDLIFKKYLIDRHPGKIIYQNVTTTDRNSEEAIKQSLVDLICISKGNKIYGSYNSTFSSFAAFIAGKNLYIIK